MTLTTKKGASKSLEKTRVGKKARRPQCLRPSKLERTLKKRGGG